MTRDSESPNRETPEARQMITNSNFRVSKCLYTPLHRKAKITKRQGDGQYHPACLASPTLRWMFWRLSSVPDCSLSDLTPRGLTSGAALWLRDLSSRPLDSYPCFHVAGVHPLLLVDFRVPPVPNLPVRLCWFPNWPHSCLVACHSPTWLLRSHFLPLQNTGLAKNVAWVFP